MVSLKEKNLERDWDNCSSFQPVSKCSTCMEWACVIDTCGSGPGEQIIVTLLTAWTQGIQDHDLQLLLAPQGTELIPFLLGQGRSYFLESSVVFCVADTQNN
jgi:hypothetical protein